MMMILYGFLLLAALLRTTIQYGVQHTGTLMLPYVIEETILYRTHDNSANDGLGSLKTKSGGGLFCVCFECRYVLF